MEQMTLTLKQVNNFARYSCSKWCPNRALRRHNRELYRAAAETYWRSEKHQVLIGRYKSGERKLDTYPWPYCDPGFADWKECNRDDSYTLISDQSGFVVKHCTSYVAWKIFETTGEWPQRKAKRTYHAQDWVRFLSDAGYKTVVEKPSGDGYYVGVNPRKGDYGEVVWYEYPNYVVDNLVYVSTYRKKQYVYEIELVDMYTWVKIK